MEVEEQKQKDELKKEELVNVNPQIANEYKNAIEQAISIAVDKNLDKIEGVTYVFCDVSGSMQSRISGGKYLFFIFIIVKILWECQTMYGARISIGTDDQEKVLSLQILFVL